MIFAGIIAGTISIIIFKKPGGIKMSVISMKQLLEAGVHFGHQTRRWNPKMAPVHLHRKKWYLHHRLTEVCR